MPANVKSLENQEKHLTKAEMEARQAAEEAYLPKRKARLKMPAAVKEDKAAAVYWRSILKRMEGTGILDDLDAEILGIHCLALSRRDRMDPEGNMKSLLALEKQLLSYADKLGLTPESRIRLARKQAAKDAESGVTDDLFGD